MTALVSNQTYQGFWIDHSRNNVLGATITTTSETAVIVVAMLSLLIGTAGSHLWDLLAFLIFLFSAPSKDNTLEPNQYQQQFLLRNAFSPGGVSLISTKMCWSWRKAAPHALLRLGSIATLATLCSVGFVVAGVLSSLVVSGTAIDVLAQSSACGYTTITDNDHTENTLGALISAYEGTLLQQSLQYSRTCYNGSASNPQCQIYTTKSVPFNTTYSACPFSSNLCLLASDKAITMDTGKLDVSDVFGINSKRVDRLLMRRVITCSPLNDSGRAGIFNKSDKPGDQGMVWYWGPSLENSLNITYGTSFLTSNQSHTYKTDFVTHFPKSNLGFNFATPSTFNPIPDLLRDDADTVLIPISPGISRYSDPVDDPVFAAHQQEVTQYGRGEVLQNRTDYLSDALTSWIGCADQTQFCLPNGNCTALTATNLAAEQSLSLGMNPGQNATMIAMGMSFASVMLAGFSVGGIAPLLVNSIISNGVTLRAKLPSNQWELEVKSWMAWLLAIQQKLLADHILGPGATGSDFENLPTAMTTSEDRALCHKQKMKASNGISNVSVFGLSFIIAFCGLVILVNTLLTNVIKWLSRHGTLQSPGIISWDRESLLQVQRRMFEAKGQGVWLGDRTDVPVTMTNTRLTNGTSHPGGSVVSNNSTSICGQKSRVSTSTTSDTLLNQQIPAPALVKSA